MCFRKFYTFTGLWGIKKEWRHCPRPLPFCLRFGLLRTDWDGELCTEVWLGSPLRRFTCKEVKKEGLMDGGPRGGSALERGLGWAPQCTLHPFRLVNRICVFRVITRSSSQQRVFKVLKTSLESVQNLKDWAFSLGKINGTKIIKYGSSKNKRMKLGNLNESQSNLYGI